jgi:hypothetical protein
MLGITRLVVHVDGVVRATAVVVVDWPQTLLGLPVSLIGRGHDIAKNHVLL